MSIESMEREKLILKVKLAPGDNIMLTAALREIHLRYPDRFLTDVRSPYPQLWENNPYITPLRENESQVLECHYPLIQRSTGPYHFIHGFIEYINDKLSLDCRPTFFKGDIHLSDEELAAPSIVEELTGQDLPYWVIVAGGKYDFTIKWWHWKRYQAVVDQLKDKILFVQTGKRGDFHPPLKGVIDQRGKTDLRQLINLIHHAQGVLCPVTLAMHLAAAVPLRAGAKLERACVVVAGGREPPQWEAYPPHRFIHTVGALECCAASGCWRLRTVPLGDGDEKDDEKHLCLDVVEGLPHCMDLITPAQVMEAVSQYNHAGVRRGQLNQEAIESYKLNLDESREKITRNL